jgi:succinoglycan biosynthesis transport protein ExoP
MNAAHSVNFSVLMHRKQTLLLSGLVAACIAFGIGKILPLTYAGEGGMIVVSADVPAGGAAADDGTSIVQTQIDVLQSKGLLARVVTDLNLTHEPDLVPVMRLPAPVLASIDAAMTYVKDLWHSLVDSVPVVPVDDNEKTIGYLQTHLQIAAKTGSKLISLRFTAGSPKVAAAVVNRVMDEYLDGDQLMQANKIVRVNDYIAQESEAMQKDIDDSQQRLVAFVQRNNLPEVQGGSAAALQLSKDEDQLSIARQQLALRQAAFDTIQKGGAVAGAEETLESPTIQSLKNYEVQIIQQIGSLGGPLDPRARAPQTVLSSIRAQIAHENDLIYQSVQRNVTIAKAKVSALEMAVKIESNRSQDMSNAGVTLKQLTNDVEIKRQSKLAFLTQAAQLRTGAHSASAAHVQFAALPPIRPAMSYASLSLILGFVGGVLAAAGTLVLRDAFGTRINSTMALEFATGLPTFGSLPDVKQVRGGGVMAARRDTRSMIEETFRAMWISMRSEQNGKGTTLVVTSSEVGEGKSAVAVALAQRFAEDGFRVLLVEGDLRRPHLASVLNLRPTHFLESVLDKSVSVTEATVHANRYGFDCLFSDGRSRNPAKVILSESFKMLLEESKKTYDFVILDSPPVLHVADPVLLAKLCEYIVFIVESGRVSSDLVAEATRRFTDEERSRMLTMLTHVKPNKMDKRDYYSGYEPDFKRIGTNA